MSGMPLHPIIVHFPIVLAFLLPISIVVALRSVGKGTTLRRGWAFPVIVAAALTASSFVASRTGEAEEERVERVVAEQAIETHEEAAERFLVLSGVLLAVSLAGFLPRTVGQAARFVTTAGALGVVAAAIQVGHSGGTLVYREGAASAYTTAAARESTRESARARPGAEEITRTGDQRTADQGVDSE
jgi:uncharacterized membrane protein